MVLTIDDINDRRSVIVGVQFGHARPCIVATRSNTLTRDRLSLDTYRFIYYIKTGRDLHLTQIRAILHTKITGRKLPEPNMLGSTDDSYVYLVV